MLKNDFYGDEDMKYEIVCECPDEITGRILNIIDMDIVKSKKFSNNDFIVKDFDAFTYFDIAYVYAVVNKIRKLNPKCTRIGFRIATSRKRKNNPLLVLMYVLDKKVRYACVANFSKESAIDEIKKELEEGVEK